MFKLKETKEYNLALSLANRNQYLDAQDRFAALLAKNNRYLPDILIPLYKRLAVQFHSLPLRILISELYLSCKQYFQAVQELEDAFDLDSNFTQTYYILGKIYRKIGRNERIKEIFEKAFEKNIEDPSILDLLPKIYLEEGNINKNIEFHERLLEIYPDKIHYYYTLAELYEKTDEFEKAGQIYKKISMRNPLDTENIITKCTELIRKKEKQLFLRELLIDLYLKSCQPLKIIDQAEEICRLNLLEPTKVIEIYQKTVKEYPNTKEVVLALCGQLIGEERYAESVIYLQDLLKINQSYVEDVVPLLSGILQKYPAQVSAKEFLIEIYFSQNKHNEVLKFINDLMDVNHFNNNVEEKLKAISAENPEKNEYASYLLMNYYLQTEQYQLCFEKGKQLVGSKYALESKLFCIKAALKLGKYKRSQKLIQQLLTEYPYHWEAHDINYNIYQKLIQRKIKNTKPKKKKDTPTACLSQGLNFLQLRDIYPALENFQKILNNDELKIQAHILMGRCFLEIGRFDLSINQLSRVLNYSTDLDIHLANKLRYLLSINLISMGKISEAVTYLENILEYDINFPKIRTILERCNNWGFFDFRGKVLAGCIIGNGEPYLVISPNMEKRSLPRDKEQNLSFAHPHNNQGVEHILKKQIKAAEDEFNLALNLDPNITAINCNLAVLSLLKDDYNNALVQLENAEKINPDFDMIWHNRGLVYIKQDQLDLALVSFQKAIKLNPDNHLARYNLGDVYYRKKEVRLAFESWKQLLSINHLFYLLRRRLEYLIPKSCSFDDWINDIDMTDLEDIFIKKSSERS